MMTSVHNHVFLIGTIDRGTLIEDSETIQFRLRFLRSSDRVADYKMDYNVVIAKEQLAMPLHEQEAVQVFGQLDIRPAREDERGRWRKIIRATSVMPQGTEEDFVQDMIRYLEAVYHLGNEEEILAGAASDERWPTLD